MSLCSPGHVKVEREWVRGLWWLRMRGRDRLSELTTLSDTSRPHSLPPITTLGSLRFSKAYIVRVMYSIITVKLLLSSDADTRPGLSCRRKR